MINRIVEEIKKHELNIFSVTVIENGVEKTYNEGSLLSIENGKLTCSDKAISANFTDSEYSLFKMKIVGLNKENEGAKIFICAFIQTDEDIFYLSNEESSQNIAFGSASIADLKKKEQE